MTTNNGLTALHAHAQRLQGKGIPSLLVAEPDRVKTLALKVGPLYVNFARQKYDRAALGALLELAAARDVAGGFARLFGGEKINITEGRAVLHSALRGDASPKAAGEHA